jgi:hypothetical protein
MLSWWHRDVIAAGKLPLMLCFVSFVAAQPGTAAKPGTGGRRPRGRLITSLTCRR